MSCLAVLTTRGGTGTVPIAIARLPWPRSLLKSLAHRSGLRVLPQQHWVFGCIIRLKMDDLRCSFCDRTQVEVNQLIASPQKGRAYICRDCVEVCSKILQDHDKNESSEQELHLYKPPSRLPMWLIRTFKLRPPS